MEVVQQFFEHAFGLVEFSQVELGEVDHEKEVLESRKQTVHPHSTWNIIIPEDHISKMHTEKAVLLHNCLYIRSTFPNLMNSQKILKRNNWIFLLKVVHCKRWSDRGNWQGLQCGAWARAYRLRNSWRTQGQPFFNSL